MTEKEKGAEQAIDSDQPIRSSSEDQFGRKRFAERIADLLISRPESSSIAIGITAPWGEGKSSVLNMIEERLTEKKIKILKFNPWRFSDEDSLLRNFYIY
jgi:predicted KAP-like P-loop ATPase